MSLSGDFDIRGQLYHFSLTESVSFDGEHYTGDEIEEHLSESDQIFYSLETEDGDTFYRWLSGPWEGFDDVEQAIQDETDAYEES